MPPETAETMSTARQVEVLVHAPPPLPIVALVGVIAAVFASTFPSPDIINQDATVQTFTNRVFPDLLSLKQLGWIRCACAAFVLFVSFRGSFIDPG